MSNNSNVGGEDSPHFQVPQSGDEVVAWQERAGPRGSPALAELAGAPGNGLATNHPDLCYVDAGPRTGRGATPHDTTPRP